MSETGPHRLRQGLARLRPALPWIALVLVAAAFWIAWGGWRHVQDGNRRAMLEQSRDLATLSMARILRNEQERLLARVQAPALRDSAARGDFEAAAAALAADWPGLEAAAVHAPTLESVYAELSDGGYGRAAVLEAAISEGRSVVRIIRESGGQALAIAAPVGPEGAPPVAVAFVRLPLDGLRTGFDDVGLDTSRAYLALRQGGVTLFERGNVDHAGAAERLATPVPGSGLRVAAALPHMAAAPLGLSGIPAFATALALLLLAYVVWRVLPRFGHAAVEATDDAPTLSEAVAQAGPDPDSTPRKGEVPDVSTSQAVRIDRSIFRAYDIRGVVGETLDAQVARLIGQAIGSLMREQDLPDIVVGRDGRLSGPDLMAGLIEGLRLAGRNVIDVGMVPTPVAYFGAYHLRTGCCVSLTGSHNPPDYNGFKIVVGGHTLSGDAIVDLHARIAEGRLHAADAPGGLSQRDIGPDYVERIASDVQLERPLKVVVDAGNGVAGEIGPRVLEAIGAEVVPLYCEIDGTFPNHHPDPSEPHNLDDLIGMVAQADADLGIAFDGDGDRLGVVTRDGENIFPDRLLMLFAEDVLERNPGAVIIFDVKSTGKLPGHILRHGGSPLMWKTGHSLIKAKMRETEAELAGEMSGHFFFSERWYGFDDGIYAAARLLEILAARTGTATEVLRALPSGVSTPEIKAQAPGGDPHAFIERFRAAAQLEGARLSTIDGVRADWADGWGLVRASNTTPVLVLRFDADDETALKRIQATFREQLVAVDPALSLPF